MSNYFYCRIRPKDDAERDLLAIAKFLVDLVVNPFTR